jgi:hypothetical protein
VSQAADITRSRRKCIPAGERRGRIAHAVRYVRICCIVGRTAGTSAVLMAAVLRRAILDTGPCFIVIRTPITPIHSLLKASNRVERTLPSVSRRVRQIGLLNLTSPDIPMHELRESRVRLLLVDLPWLQFVDGSRWVGGAGRHSLFFSVPLKVLELVFRFAYMWVAGTNQQGPAVPLPLPIPIIMAPKTGGQLLMAVVECGANMLVRAAECLVGTEALRPRKQ